MLVTQPPQPGEKREYQSFEISLSTLNEATIDVLFSKNKVSEKLAEMEPRRIETLFRF